MKTKYWKLFLFFGIFAMIGAINGFIQIAIKASSPVMDKQDIPPLRRAIFIIIGISFLSFYFSFKLKRLHKKGIMDTNKNER